MVPGSINKLVNSSRVKRDSDFMGVLIVQVLVLTECQHDARQKNGFLFSNLISLYDLQCMLWKNQFSEKGEVVVDHVVGPEPSAHVCTGGR